MFVAVDCKLGAVHCCALAVTLAIIPGVVSGTYDLGFRLAELTLDSTGEV